MFFMIVWLIVFGIIILLFVISRSTRDRRVKINIDKITGFLAVLQLLILMVTLATKDPLFESLGLPREYEWLAGLFISGFTLWQFYLSPLKERVIETEKEVRVIKSDITHIKETTDKLEKKFFS